MTFAAPNLQQNAIWIRRHKVWQGCHEIDRNASHYYEKHRAYSFLRNASSPVVFRSAARSASVLCRLSTGPSLVSTATLSKLRFIAEFVFPGTTDGKCPSCRHLIAKAV